MAETGVRATISDFRNGEWDTLAAWQFHTLATIFTVYYTVREFMRDRGHILAASLAFTTALSLVPLLSVATSILAIFGTFDPESTGVQSFLQVAFPAVASDAATYLSEFASTSATSVGGVSAMIFVVIGVLLFAEMEATFNVIWGAPSDRKFFKKMLNFYFVVTLGPLLLSLSVGMSARASFVLERMGLEVGFLATVSPFVLALGLFALMHWLMPNTKVRWPAALAGGLFTAYAFKAGQWGFNLYVNEVVFESYRTIYGALGLFPIFLIWIYVSWIIVLVGAELAYAVQNLRTLVEVDAAHLRVPSKQKDRIHNPLVGLEVLAPIAARFKRGQGTTPETELIRLLGYNEVFLRSVLVELAQLNAVRTVEDPETGERGVLPARSLEDITLLPIAEHFFDVSEPNSAPMTELADAYYALMNQTLSGKNAMSLVGATDTMKTLTENNPYVVAAEVESRAAASATSRPSISSEAPAIEPAPDHEFELPPELQAEVDDEPYRESTFIDIPDMPAPDAEPDPPPALPTVVQDELTPRMEAPAWEAPDVNEGDSGNASSGLDDASEPDGADPPALHTLQQADYSAPAIPVSDDLVIEESEAFEDDDSGGESVVSVDDEAEIPALEGHDVDVSMEIDLGADWDDFDVDQYDDALSAADGELQDVPNLDGLEATAGESIQEEPETEEESLLAGVVRKANELRETAEVSLDADQADHLKKLRQVDDM